MKAVFLIIGGVAAAVAIKSIMGGGGSTELPGTDDDSERTGAFSYRGFWILIDNDGKGRKRWTWDVRTDLNGQPAAEAFGEGAEGTRQRAMEAAQITINNIVDS